MTVLTDFSCSKYGDLRMLGLYKGFGWGKVHTHDPKGMC